MSLRKIHQHNDDDDEEHHQTPNTVVVTAKSGLKSYSVNSASYKNDIIVFTLNHMVSGNKVRHPRFTIRMVMPC